MLLSKCVVGWQAKCWSLWSNKGRKMSGDLWSDQGYRWIWFLWWNSIMFWPLKLSLRHSHCANWNKQYKTPLWLFKTIMPIAGCLCYWASVLKGSDFYLLNVFGEDFTPHFFVSVCYDCGRKSDVWMNLSGRQTQLCMTFLNMFTKWNACKTAP